MENKEIEKDRLKEVLEFIEKPETRTVTWEEAIKLSCERLNINESIAKSIADDVENQMLLQDFPDIKQLVMKQDEYSYVNFYINIFPGSDRKRRTKEKALLLANDILNNYRVGSIYTMTLKETSRRKEEVVVIVLQDGTEISIFTEDEIKKEEE